MSATQEQADALRARLKSEGLAKYPKYAVDTAWPYLGDDFYFNALRANTEDEVSTGFWLCLDAWQGNAYNYFVGLHDGGAGLYYYLAFGGSTSGFVKPPELDNRYAPANTAIQLGYMALGQDAYGNPLSEFFMKRGQENFAALMSNRPPWLWTTDNETVHWLLYNNFVLAITDKNAWGPYMAKTIAECVLIVEKVNHPGRG